MRSTQVTNGETIFASNLHALRSDARAAGHFHVHQQYGAITLPTNPSNTQTLTLTINGTAITVTFVSAIGSTAGNVLIGATAAATAINLLSLLANPNVTNTTQVALSTGNQLLVSYLSWSLSGTTLTPGSLNTLLSSPATSFSVSTTATGGAYTANTMRLYIEPGTAMISGGKVVYAGGSTATFTAPVSNPRIDVISITSAGSIVVTAGTENASPSVPTYPTAGVVLAEVYHQVGETSLCDNSNQVTGQGYIQADVRPFVRNVANQDVDPAANISFSKLNCGAISADLIPDADGTRNLGSGSFQWNNIYAKTGIFLGGVSVNSQNTSSFTAGESVSAGIPVCALSYPANDVTYDNSLYGTGTGSTITSSNITIGANSNRYLFVQVEVTNNFSVTGVTFNGSSMTLIDSLGANPGLYTFGIIAPTTGAHAVVISTNNASASVKYYIYSYYNVRQNVTPASHSINQFSGSVTPFSQTFNPTVNGSVVLVSVLGATSISGVGPNHQLNSGDIGDTGTQYPMSILTATGTYPGSGLMYIMFFALEPVQTSAVMRVYKTMATIAQRVTSYIGIAQGTATVGNAVTVATSGVDANQSGLTIATQYYLADTAGTFGISAGTVSRKAGIAVDTTKMLITNIW